MYLAPAAIPGFTATIAVPLTYWYSLYHLLFYPCMISAQLGGPITLLSQDAIPPGTPYPWSGGSAGGRAAGVGVTSITLGRRGETRVTSTLSALPSASACLSIVASPYTLGDSLLARHWYAPIATLAACGSIFPARQSSAVCRMRSSITSACASLARAYLEKKSARETSQLSTVSLVGSPSSAQMWRRLSPLEI